MGEQGTNPKLKELVAAGFVKTAKAGSALWRLQTRVGKNQKRTIRSKSVENIEGVEKVDSQSDANVPVLVVPDTHPRILSPWALSHWTISLRDPSRISTTKFELKLRKNELARSFGRAVETIHGGKCHGQVQLDGLGAFWCFLEFTRIQSDKSARRDQGLLSQDPLAASPLGFAGFRVAVSSHANGGLSVTLSRHFAVGWVSPSFWEGLFDLVANTLGVQLDRVSVQSLFEMHIDLDVIALDLINSDALGEDTCAQLVAGLEAAPVRIVDSADAWTVEGPVSDSLVDRYRSGPTPPIEVLEGRELERGLSDIDVAFAEGHLEKASKLVSAEIGANRIHPMLVRRAAFLIVAGYMRPSSPVWELLSADLGSLIAQSAVLAGALVQADHEAALDALSEIGEQLTKVVPSIETVAAFELVIPELLGDLWFHVDPEKARECWVRVLSRRGELGRVLAKLASLAAKLGDAESERTWLERLVAVERRRGALASAHLRIAQLAAQSGADSGMVLEEALRAVEKSGGENIPSVELSVQAFLELDRAPEAVDLLDRVLREARGRLTPHGRGHLEFLAATVWMRDLARPDIAIRRLETAVRLDPKQSEWSETLIRCYRDAGQVSEMIAHGERQLALLDPKTNGQRMRELVFELVEVLTGVGQTNRAMSILQSHVSQLDLDLEEVRKLSSKPELNLNWQEIHDHSESKMRSEVDGHRKVEWARVLAVIARERLHDTTASMRHLMEIMHSGALERSEFEALEHVLRANKAWSSLVELYETRLNAAPASEQAMIVQEMMSLPSGISEDKRDRLAIWAWKVLPEGEKYFIKRLHWHVSVDDPAAISTLCLALLSEAPSTAKLELVRISVEALQECIDPTKFAGMAKILGELSSDGIDQRELARYALSCLLPSGEPAFMLPWVEKILNAGERPVGIDQHQMAKIVAGKEHLLSRWHELSAAEASTPEIAAASLRIAYALAVARPGREESGERILAHICRIVSCSDNDLEHLRILVAKTGHWPIYVESLERQIQLEKDGARKNKLLLHLADTWKVHVGDLEKAKSVLRRVEANSDKPWLVLFETASMAFAGGQEGEGVSELLRLVDSALDGGDFESVVKALRLVAERENGKDAVRAASKSLIAKVNSSPEQTGRLASVFVECGVASVDMYASAFNWLVKKDRDRAKRVWVDALKSMASASRTREFIKTTRAAADGADDAAIFGEALRQVFVEGVINKLHKRTKREILVQYGLLLFESESKRKKALRVFREVWGIDSNDSRIWMPLYFLNQEFGTPEERMANLRELIPKLVVDPTPLRKLPLTMESLQAELDNLERAGGAGDQAHRTGIHWFKPKEVQLVDGEKVADFKVVEREYRDDAVALPQIVETEQPAARPVARLAENGVKAMELPRFEIGNVNVDSAAAVDLGTSVAMSLESSVELQPELTSIVPSPASGSDLVESSVGALESEIAPVILPEVQLNFDLAPRPELTMVHGFADAPGAEQPVLESVTTDLTPSVQHLDLAVAEPQLDLVPDLRESSSRASSPSQVPESDSLGATLDLAGLDLQPELPPLPELGDLPPPAQSFSLGDDFTGVSDLSLELASGSQNSHIVTGQEDAHSSSSNPESSSDSSEGVERFKINSLELTFDTPPPPPPNEMSLDLGGVEDRGADSESGSGTHVSEAVEPIDSGLVSEVQASSLRVSADSASSLPVLDWRTVLRSGSVSADAVPRVFGQAFASELEKHVALQAVALMTGSCDKLTEWHWRVWRYPREYGYQLSGKERYPSGLNSKILGGHLHRLVTLLAPLLIRAYPEKFNLENVAGRLKKTVQQVEQTRRLIKWDSGILAVVGLSLFKDRLNAHRYHAFHVSGLGKQIFYEGRTRSIHFDEQYWQGRPPSHLFHRILGILRSVRLHYFVPLELDPIRDVMPIVNDLKSTWEASGIGRLKYGLGISKNRVSKFLDVVDENQLRPIIEKMGTPQYDSFIKLWDAMNEHLCRLIMAETLDIIGMFETLTDRDLTAAGALKPGEILQLSPLAPGLFDFLTKLKV